MKVLHLTSVHPRPNTRIFFRECVSLAEAGVDVTLICPEPEWPYPNSNVRVIEMPRAGNRLRRMTGTVLGVMRRAFATDADIVHIHSPELLPAGMLLKLRGRKVVFDSHEDLPDQVAAKGWIPGPLKGVVSLFAKMLIGATDRMYDGIVAATPTIAEDFSPDKTIVLRNLPPKSEIDIDVAPEARTSGPIIFAGGLSGPRGTRQLVEAMGKVGPATGRTLKLYGVFAPPEFQDEVEVLPGWEWVEFEGYIHNDQMPQALAEASIGIVTYLDSPNHHRAEPNKIFEYMLAGMPFVASNFEYWEQFVTDPGTGIQVDPADADALADAIIYLVNNPDVAAGMGARGRELALAHYTWDAQVEPLLDFYHRILAS